MSRFYRWGVVRYLLLQARNPDDPMRSQEVDCFARALVCARSQIRVIDLITSVPSAADLGEVDVVLLGGSGDHSVAEGGDWLPAALDAMRELYQNRKPTFASCWGFQAMARAMGGLVVTDRARAELGSIPIQLTAAGESDPIFGRVTANPFLAQMGHQDIVDSLPEDAVLLASSEKVLNQAFHFVDRPIYCTQFHPELNRASILERVHAYPQYVQKIAEVSMEMFEAGCRETPETDGLLRDFVAHVLD